MLLGKGDGTLLAPTYYSSGADPGGVAITDVNGDGTSDIAVPTVSGAKIFLGLPVTADLTIAGQYTGVFTQARAASTCWTVANIALVLTTGTVTVTDSLPAGTLGRGDRRCRVDLHAGSACCTRSDALPASASYPAIMGDGVRGEQCGGEREEQRAWLRAAAIPWLYLSRSYF